MYLIILIVMCFANQMTKGNDADDNDDDDDDKYCHYMCIHYRNVYQPVVEERQCNGYLTRTMQ